MTIRAFTIAAVMVLVICGLAFVNQHIARLQGMIGGALPLVVFASLMAMVILINPVLTRVRPTWALSGGELAVIVCLSLGVCAYTGSSFFRYFGTSAILPAHTVQTRPGWQAAQVMSYVPGHVGALAPGQLLEPEALAREVLAQRERDTALGRLWRLSDESGRRAWRDAAEAGAGQADRAQLARVINRVLVEPSFLDPPIGDAAQRLAAGRWALQEAVPGLLAPPPRGRGILLNDGVYDASLMDGFLFGDPAGAVPHPKRVPWRAWWPVIRMWGGLMVLLVLAAICLAVIVRPQWAEHERLAFPIVRFTELMIQRDGHHSLPDIARTRMFWVGFSVVALHLINGLHAWFPALPHLPLELDLSPLRTLFPNASRAWQSWGVFTPTLNLTVVAFSFLLPRTITLTFGVTNLVYLAAFAMITARGMSTADASARVSFDVMVNFGAMLAMVGTLLYTGRRYYSRVLAAAAMPGVARDTPRPPVWALRAMAGLIPLAIGHIIWHGGTPVFAALAVGLVLMLWLVNARIVCETGLYRVGMSILPVGVIVSVFGVEAVGPTQIILLAMLGVMLALELWETPMAYATTGLELARRFRVNPRTLIPSLMGTAMVGFLIALIVTLTVQYHFGMLGRDEAVVERRAVSSMALGTQAVTDLTSHGTLPEVVGAGGLERLARWSPNRWALGWAGVGMALFALFAVARYRLPWWPIHPIVFVLLGNWGLVTFGFSFLIGWAIKSCVISTAGVRGYQQLLPLMCGLIAGGLFSAAIWLTVGIVYFLRTGIRPETYIAF